MTRKFKLAASAAALIALVAAGAVFAHEQNSGNGRWMMGQGHGGDGSHGQHSGKGEGYGNAMGGNGGDQMHSSGRGRGEGRFQEMLATHDINGDGSVTEEELDSARAALLAGFDANGDGSLNLAEFQALWLERMREHMVDQFQSHDDDGDGLVTAEEFGEMQARMVARMDRNGDGMLNADDFLRRGAGSRRGQGPGNGSGPRGVTPSE